MQKQEKTNILIKFKQIIYKIGRLALATPKPHIRNEHATNGKQTNKIWLSNSPSII